MAALSHLVWLSSNLFYIFAIYRLNRKLLYRLKQNKQLNLEYMHQHFLHKICNLPLPLCSKQNIFMTRTTDQIFSCNWYFSYIRLIHHKERFFSSRINPHLFLQHVVKTFFIQYASLMRSSYWCWRVIYPQIQCW